MDRASTTSISKHLQAMHRAMPAQVRMHQQGPVEREEKGRRGGGGVLTVGNGEGEGNGDDGDKARQHDC